MGLVISGHESDPGSMMFRKLLVMKDMKSALSYSDVFSDGPKISLEAKVLIVALVKTIFTHYKNTNKEKICFLVSICGILTFSVNPTKKTKMTYNKLIKLHGDINKMLE